MIADHAQLCELQTHRFTVGADAVADIWAEANQYQLADNVHSLVVVRNAQKITDWAPFMSWLNAWRELPKNNLILISSEADFPTAPPKPGEKTRTLLPHVQAIQRRGTLLKCSAPTPTKTKDQFGRDKTNIAVETKLAEWITARTPMPADTARYLALRASGQLDVIRDVCDKLALFDVAAGIEVIDALCPPQPAEVFEDALTMGNRYAALEALPAIPDGDYGRIIGALDYRLGQLRLLNQLQKNGLTTRAIAADGRVSQLFVSKFGPYAKHYDQRRVRQSRAALALVDSVLRQGARVGVLEVLVMAF